MKHVLAVDGGNSKTVAMVARSDGTILGTGRAGYADIYGVVSPETALAQVEAAVAEAREDAGIAMGEIDVGAFTLAGADWPEDYELLHQELLSRQLARRVLVYHDSFGALRAGSADGTGVGVVIGLGTALGARSPDGRVWCGGFWQADATGAGDLGTAAVRLVLRAELGIDPATSLTERLLDFFQTSSVQDLLHNLTRRGAPRCDLGQLAPLLLEACEQGDPSARQVVETQGKTIGDYATAAARSVGLGKEAFPLVLAGGLLRTSSATLEKSIIDRAQAHSPLVVPTRAPFEPVVGTLFLALEGAGVAVDAAIDSQVRATLPPSTRLATFP